MEFALNTRVPAVIVPLLFIVPFSLTVMRPVAVNV